MKLCESETNLIMKKPTVNNTSNKQSVLVTGGLGFIGAQIVSRLIESGYHVIIIDNCSNSDKNVLKKFVSDKYTYFDLDICSKEDLINTLKKYKADAIIHLAAVHFIPFCNNNPKETIKINYGGTKNILKLGKKLDIKKFIFASSAAVYKISYKPYSEKDVVKPIDIYGKSKLKAESYIQESYKHNGIPFTILRLFNVYGNGDLTSHFIPALLSQVKSSKSVKVGNLDTIRDYIHVNDVVNMFISVINKSILSRNQIFNVGTGKGTTGKEVISIIRHNISRKADKFKVVIDEHLTRKNDRQSLVSNNTKASTLLGWNPKIKLVDGLNSMIKNNH